MTIIKEDRSKNDLRVVEKFSIFPKYILRANKFIFFERYYQLQLRVGLFTRRKLMWKEQETSLNIHEWDFKWNENYLSLWK